MFINQEFKLKNSTLLVMYNQRNCRIESLKIQAWTDYQLGTCGWKKCSASICEVRVSFLHFFFFFEPHFRGSFISVLMYNASITWKRQLSPLPPPPGICTFELIQNSNPPLPRPELCSHAIPKCWICWSIFFVKGNISGRDFLLIDQQLICLSRP